MLKSKLFWKVLGNFGLLLLILTAMTVVTLSLLNQIQKNFSIASADTRALSTLERIGTLVYNVPMASYRYALASGRQDKDNYMEGWRELLNQFTRFEQTLPDSVSLAEMQLVKENCGQWKLSVGDRLIALGDERASRKQVREFESRMQDLLDLELANRYLDASRSLVQTVQQARIPLQESNIAAANNDSTRLSTFIILINVLLSIFAIALGFVLTRSITKPIGLLIGGTQSIMAGRFEPIAMHRTDELGDLASDFNKMSSLLGNNYNRLNAYSELVTTLNSSASMEDVQRKALEILCKHTRASIGALYLVIRGQRALELVSGYALRKDRVLEKRLAFGEGIPGECAAEGREIELTDIPGGSGFVLDTGFVELVPSYILAVPVFFREEILGVLVLGATKKFGDLEKEIVNNSVPQLGVALTNAMNFEETRSLSVEITKRNEELSAKNKEIEKAYKVKSEFLSSMSHELRTPLNSIIGFSSVLLGPSGDPLSPDQRMALEKVLKNGKHLLQLINDILDISKLESGRMMLSVETEDVATIISNCVLIVEPLIQSKRLNITQNIPQNLPPLTTDIVKVRQILVNLLSNAAKFTEKGGIAITVRQSDTGIVSFLVKDTGIGIESKNFDRVFEEFQQVDSSSTRKYKGTGLGLPIARRLARMLGGDLMVESELGKGSTFTLTVPSKLPTRFTEMQSAPQVLVPVPQIAHPEPPRPQQVVQGSIPHPLRTGQQVQILSIDDDPDVIEILRKYLVPEGYSLIGALSGDEGLDIATKVKPDLITLDIMMPKKDGWQVLRELKANPDTKDIPVIIHSIIDNRPLALSLGAVDVMMKPTDPKRLLTLVKKHYKSGDQFILVVDDNLDFALACKDLLKRDGFNVKIATRGEEAVKILEESIPSLILLDLVMPGMDGFNVIHALQSKEQWTNIPVVVLTGKSLSDEDHKSLDPFIADYLMKDSFTTAAISGAIKKILNVAPLST
jgi:signal transduction histidine kinase/DNA-binding response OmpR family regulator/CHASE3 domain sensor protein